MSDDTNSSATDSSNQALSSRLVYGANGIQTLVKELEVNLKELEEKIKHWEHLQERMKHHADAAKTKIKLDVGGKIFAASKDTLLSVEGTFFFAMLSSGHWEPGEDGAYFIDRSPTYFPYVINYLRSGECDFMHKLSRLEFEKLKGEFDYYQVEWPKTTIRWDTNIDVNYITYTDDAFTTTKSANNSAWNTNAISASSAVYFKIKVVNRGGNGHIMIGFNDYPSNFSAYGSNYGNDRSYCLYIHNGALYGNGKNCQSFFSAVSTGSIITGFHDRAARTISFAINDGESKVAFTNVQPAELRVFCNFHEYGGSVAIC